MKKFLLIPFILFFIPSQAEASVVNIAQYVYRTGGHSYRYTFCDRYDNLTVEKILLNRERTVEYQTANLMGAQIARTQAFRKSVPSCINPDFPNYLLSRTRSFRELNLTPEQMRSIGNTGIGG